MRGQRLPHGVPQQRLTTQLQQLLRSPQPRRRPGGDGGPRTAPPSTRGLGMDLIEGAIIYQLAGKVDFRFTPAGLECDLVVPLKDDVPADTPHLGPDNPTAPAAASHPLPG